ncbi:hypothetical protein [Flavilitoribacter nigricans]|uniref:Uncharacterized protein n=1 Tax=Flavilitoribacter nigricans (strain ATCC 23147 / DSM 23189 / NBRC 102662 / NCIMB 1420 / SS-2) TaxID=1122177 RepID=A0A2D0MWG5_FLAN2|nr:hypothetical protein [Flavilitoribacter nigricans]PHN00575.1 hypothetical protein CRP01_41515 [Flavilitoribacter nigricans DSM 23189 = NBRC 102662]
MKKIYLLALAMMIAGTGMFAQLYSLNFEKIKASTGNYELSRVMTSYDARSGIATLDLKNIKDGRNYLATDKTNGRRLFLLAKRDGSRVKIGGFAVQDRSGRWIDLGSQAAGKGGDDFGCPDGWDSKIICYTHPTYNVTVCYTRCTPTQLTMSLPSGL